MDQATAEKFATEWISAWNDHDLQSIMEHYNDDIHFISPFVATLGINQNGIIDGKPPLQDYFRVALDKYPQLKFELIHCLTGQHSVVLYYKSINHLFAAEWMEFGPNDRISRVVAHYASS